MAGYTRQSVASIINGANITAPPLNAEFNQILAAFNASTGHSHDGSTGNAPKIDLTTSLSGYLPVVHGGVGGKNNTTATTDPTTTDDNTQGYAPGSIWINASTGYVHLCLFNTTSNANWVTVAAISNTNIIAPKATNTVDIGTSTLQFKNIYADGIGYIDDINSETMSSTGNTDVGGNLSVTGNGTVGGTFGVTGNTTVGGTATVTGNVTASANLSVGGNTTLTGTLSANGNVTLGNAASDTVTFTADVASDLIPSADGTHSLGAVGSEWQDLFIDGTANIDSLVADTADINAGSIDGTVLGAGSPASASFTGLTVSSTVNFNGATVSDLGSVSTADINGGTIDGVTIGTNSAVTDLRVDNLKVDGNAITSTNTNGNIDLTPAGTGEVNISKVDIDSGAIDGTTIGSSSATSGAFTTVTTSGQATLATVDINGGTIDGTAIGSNTTASGAFTTVSASGGFTGAISGNVTGNVTGNLTGNVTGNVTGDVTGDLTGNVTASTGTSTFENVVVNGTANFTSTALTNVVDPTNLQDAATKNYVDTNDALKVTKAGDSMTGNLTMSGGAKVTGLPTPTVSSDAATKGYVDTEVANLVDSAPGALDTLNELADALGDDPNFSTTITNSIATKLPKAGGTMTGAIAMSTNKLTGVGDPTAAQDAATKNYVDTNDALKLNLSGGTMSGVIAMGSNKVTGVTDPTNAQDASTKAYTDAQRDTRLATAGGTMTGNISIGTNKITTTADPTNANDLARKSYVDTIHGSAVAAATSATNSANSATASANSATASANSASASASSASSAAASYDLFDDRFLGAKSSAPTVDNDGDALVVGSLYFDTTAQIMKVYGSSGWQSAGSAVNGTSERFKYTATSNQTTFSGNDDAGNALGYDAGFLDVYLSGVKLVNGTDFTATSGTSVQLVSGAATGDILEIVTYGTFVLSNQSLSDMQDVNTGGVSTNDVLAYNGSNFVPTSTPTFTSIASSGTLTISSGHLNLSSDGAHVYFGADVDMRMFHDGANGKITNSTGGFYIGSDIVGIQNSAHNVTYLNFASGGAATFNAGLIVNESGGNSDFRAESQTNTHMLFVDASNNRVGIGKSNPARTLDLHGSMEISVNTASHETFIFTTGAVDDAKLLMKNASGSTTVQLSANGDTLFNGGNVGIGQAPTAFSNWRVLELKGGSAGAMLNYENSSSARVAALAYDESSTALRMQTMVNAPIKFEPNNAVALTLDGSQNATFAGNVATSGYVTASRAFLDNSGDWNLESGGSANGLHMRVRHSSTDVGSIQSTTTGTNFNTTSDLRLKTEIKSIDSATNKLMAMNPVSHKWKADPEADEVHGFIAQEMMEIVPEAVSGDPDSDEMMSMDYGRITPVIVAALQEANNKIMELEERIKELEDN